MSFYQELKMLSTLKKEKKIGFRPWPFTWKTNALFIPHVLLINITCRQVIPWHYICCCLFYLSLFTFMNIFCPALLFLLCCLNLKWLKLKTILAFLLCVYTSLEELLMSSQHVVTFIDVGWYGPMGGGKEW